MYRKLALSFLILLGSTGVYASGGLFDFSTIEPLDMVSDLSDQAPIEASVSGSSLLIPGINSTLSLSAQLRNIHKKSVANILLLDMEVLRSEEILTQHLSDAIAIADNDDGSIEDELMQISTWAYDILNQ